MSCLSATRLRRVSSAFAGVALIAAACLSAGAAPEWLQHAIGGSAVEAALYRMMSLPGGDVLYPRPPAESVTELDKLMAAHQNAALHSLRARQEEQALQFDKAEADWKAYVDDSPNHVDAQVELAGFYQRRHEVKAEYAARLAIGASPATAQDATTPPVLQRSWQSFERAIELAREQDFDDATTRSAWQQWIARYPSQPAVYERAFQWELDHAHASEAAALVTKYRAAFPQEPVFPVKAQALLALHAGGPDVEEKAIAVYDAAFRPLWPGDLLSSYFALLDSEHRTRAFLSAATERLQQNPDDYEAAARLFVYYRQRGDPQQAIASLDRYRAGKAQRQAAWSADELFTCAQLEASVGDYPDAARYSFALAETQGDLADGRTAHEAGLAGMIDALVAAPSDATALGAGNLSMYRDIATLDQGPGYWNGILSLWLNSQSPEAEFAGEDAKAEPYFHRAKAAELLAQLDQDAPQSPDRAPLHAKLLAVYQQYGDDAAVLREGAAFLRDFPHAEDRVNVALATADVYARQNRTTEEFAFYDQLLRELAQQTQGLPLTYASLQPTAHPSRFQPAESDSNEADSGAPKPNASSLPAFQVSPGTPELPPNPAAVAYSQVLERYLARLTQAHQNTQALAVLRRELDRNPNDPLIYDRLAQFLEANNLSAQTEELYRTAIARFDGGDWYSKLARFYLRQRRTSDYAELVRQVTRIFSGTDLDSWFSRAQGGSSQLRLELNLYAHHRFPHDTVFIQNLLNLYSVKPTRDMPAWEALLRQTWWESPELTQEFFAFLSQNGKLDTEIASLHASEQNTAAAEELARAEMWRSHFEASGPLLVQLAQQYPADEIIGTPAADVERSLAWLDPAGPQQKIAAAVAIEANLLSSQPANTTRMERIGDILADHSTGDPPSLAASSSYWRRIPTTAPGNRDLYLESATVFWDYFQFDEALAEIRAARRHFSDPALFGYEAGAIDESKGDMTQAVAEYTSAALATQQAEGEARSRLLTLARRKATSSLVDASTAAAMQKQNNLASLQLRVEVLEEQQRPKEVAPLLTSALARASTADELAEIAAYAGSHNQPTVQEAALDRESRAAADPVQRLQLRYELANAYEAGGDTAAAARVIETAYHDNPRLLGVIRATVDFDWRTKHPQEAVRVLVNSARLAQPAYAEQFTAEASEKANSSGDLQQARSLAESLLAKNSYDARDLSLVANTYAADPAGLAIFYQAQLNALRAETMPPQLKKERTALLRRGLIPALAKSGNNAGAMDQYIALTSAYPEDEALVNEAALFALRAQRQQQWLDFLAATNRASPRDSRFFADLAMTESVFSDPAAAVAAYAHALAIRSDRVDWYIAKASLEDSLGRFDDEASDDTRLYQLTYHDPQWMIAVARTRARQGRTADAVVALKIALLHGAQSAPHDYFIVAVQLESWNLLPQARQYAETGAAKAGAGLLNADGKLVDDGDATSYARILTRSHDAGAVLALLRNDLAKFPEPPPAPSVANPKANPQAASDAELQRNEALLRHQHAEQTFTTALRTIADTADTYDTPEERATFAALIEAQGAAASDQDLQTRWIPVAQSAHLAALEVMWRTRLLLAPTQTAMGQLQPLNTLEHARMRYAELAETLGRFASVHAQLPAPSEAHVLLAEAQLSDGNEGAALHTLAQDSNVLLQSSARDLYIRLLLRHDPQGLAALAAYPEEDVANAAANAALTQAPLPVALVAISARGRTLDPVWSAQYKAFAGLFDRDVSSATGTSFRSALAWDRTIGERIATKPDTAHHLTSAVYFYGAARYGQWLQTVPAQGDPEDAMAAELEHEPTDQTYRDLAQSYTEAGHPEAALIELGHALELEPNSPDLDDAMAVVLWSMGRHDDAIAAWRRAFTDLRTLEEGRGAVPETFWTDFALVTRHVAARGLSDTLRSSVEDVLRTYLAHNGSYRSNELLRAAFTMWPNPDAGATELLALAAASRDQYEILSDVDSAAWLPPAARERILSAELALARASNSAATASDDSMHSGYRVQSTQRKLLSLYFAQHRDREAHDLLLSLSAQERTQPENQVMEIVLAARMGTLRALLDSYTANPDHAPPSGILQKAATQLASDSAFEPARQLLEFDFVRAETAHTLEPGQFLALAEARLRTQDFDGAVAILRTLIASGGDTYANLDSGAALLERHNRYADAVPLLDRLARSVPWEMTYAVRLAEAQSKAHIGDPIPALTAVASSPVATYALRVRAARDLAGLHAAASGLGSGELNLLSSGQASPQAAAQPYFTLARAQAAQEQTDASAKATLLRGAIAISPYGPESDAMRRSLFHAYIAVQSIAAARTTLDEWLAARANVNGMRNLSAPPYNTQTEDGEIEQLNTSQEEDPSTLDEMATVYLATGDRSLAEDALEREKVARRADEPAQTALAERIQSLRALDRLDAANAARRPVIRKELAQPLIVRARLDKAPEDMAPQPTEDQP
jgi:hypothetical protein